MTLMQEQLDILNHVVVDGQAWADNAKHPDHVLDKIERHRQSYNDAVALGGYKTRAEREEEARISDIPSSLQLWERSMDNTDRFMPRYAEDILDGMADKSGVAQISLDRLQAKKDLRATKP